jgi:general secretion pathway protein I
MTRHCGFTLVEVMVALLLLGITLPALVTQVLTQTEATAALRDRTLAAWVARDELERLRLQQRLTGVLPQGEVHGERRLGELAWEWTLDTQATALAGVQRQTITVRGKESPAVYSLTAYTAPRPALQEAAQP